MDNHLSSKIKRYISLTHCLEVVRYGLVTISSYIILFIGTFLLVEKWGFPSNLAYFILITLIYVGVYISYTKFVFKEKFKKEIFKRFIIVLIGTWILNNLFFNLMTNIFGISYIITMILNTLILGIIRFTVQKLYVFKV